MASYHPYPAPFLTDIMTGGVVPALYAAAPDLESVAAAYRERSQGRHYYSVLKEVLPGPGLPNSYLRCSVVGEYAEFYEFGNENMPGTHALEAAVEATGKKRG
jgi:hypothetical protein